LFFGQLHLEIFLPPSVWARRRQPPTGKSAEHGGHVTRPETVAPVCLGPPKCADVGYNHTNLPCQVYLLYVITCCGEIVTPSAVSINHLLSTAMPMLSNKWKASYDCNRKYKSKLEETVVWVRNAANGSEAAYCKLCHCNILPRISNLSNHEKSEKHKWRTPLQGQTRLNIRKTPRQDMDKFMAVELQIALSMTCHCVIHTFDHLCAVG
jgi:hypothetical protein